jgi:Zn-dependent protease with chaperone function
MIWSTGLAICVLVLVSELPGARPHGNPGEAFCWTLTLCLVPIIWAALAEHLAWRAKTSPAHSAGVPVFVRSAVLIGRAVWLAASGGIVIFSGWPQLIRGNLGLAAVPLIDEFLIASPIIFSGMFAMALLWRAASLGQTDQGIGGGTGLVRGLSMFGPQLRIVSGLIVFPAALLFLLRDLSEMFLTNSGPLAMGAWGCGTVFFLTGIYPSLASAMWKTTRLPCRALEAKLLQEADERGLSRVPVRAWLTDRQVVNGVVIGLFGWNRRILLTDGLLQQFDEREIMAIFRHELGHVAGKHMWIRILVLVAPVLLFCGLFAAQGNLDSSGLNHWSPANWTTVAGAMILVLLFWLLIAIPVFRRCEILADRYAVRDGRGIPCEKLADDYCSAMLKMAALNPCQWQKGTMLHPSLRSRVSAVCVYACPHLANNGTQADIGEQNQTTDTP